MHSYTGLYTAIKGYAQLYSPVQSYTALNRRATVTQDYTQLYGVYSAIYTAIQGYTQL